MTWSHTREMTKSETQAGCVVCQHRTGEKGDMKGKKDDGSLRVDRLIPRAPTHRAVPALLPQLLRCDCEDVGSAQGRQVNHLGAGGSPLTLSSPGHAEKALTGQRNTTLTLSRSIQ